MQPALMDMKQLLLIAGILVLAAIRMASPVRKILFEEKEARSADPGLNGGLNQLVQWS
jgi:hypothetical protein